MSNQSISNPEEANGKPIMVGDRGGLKVKDGISAGKATPAPSVKPAYTLEGPGYDIAFFKADGGFKIKYKGPNAEQLIKDIEKEIANGMPIKQAIDKVRFGDD